MRMRIMWYDRHPQVGKHVLFHDNGSTHYHAFFCHKELAPNSLLVHVKNKQISIIWLKWVWIFHNSVHIFDLGAQCASLPWLLELPLNYAYTIIAAHREDCFVSLPAMNVVWPRGTVRSKGDTFLASSRHSFPQKSNRPFLGWLRHMRQAEPEAPPALS
jgi:hypothetical protein